jgi:L-amino acid N-acyltransferase YncA
VRTFLASIASDNEPSMRLALGLGFRQIGVEVDEEGLEFIYELMAATLVMSSSPPRTLRRARG